MCQNNDKVSIIVPIYNQKKYIEECINSIINQTYQEIEIILVDDGSTDGCEKICDKYASLDQRIKVVHKKNGGLVSAWKTGVESSSSKYIAFVDSDDRISDYYIEKMVIEQKKTDADLIATNIIYFMPDESQRKYIYNIKPKYYDRHSIESELYPILINTGKFQDRAIHTSRCGKLIKTELIKQNMNYTSEQVTYEEDFNTMIPIFLDMNSVSRIDDESSIYFVRENPDSMTHRYDNNMLNSIDSVYLALEKVICKNKYHRMFLHQLEAEYLAAMVQHYKNMLLFPGKTQECLHILHELYHDNSKLTQALNDVDWHNYRNLNRLIIFCISHPEGLLFDLITTILKMLKKVRVNILVRKEKLFNF